jgi:arylsulfatase A-like enzyme
MPTPLTDSVHHTPLTGSVHHTPTHSHHTPQVQRWFRTGYYAAVSQTDAMIGLVLAELDTSRIYSVP